MLNKKMKDYYLKASVLICLAAFTLMTGTALTAKTALATQYEYVTTDSISLRSGMSTDTSRIAMIPAGEVVDVISVSSNYSWANVEWNGHRGYVLTMYLNLEDVEGRAAEPEKSGSSSTNSSASSDGYHMYVNQVANIRVNPVYGATPLFRVSTGTDLHIIDRIGEYFKVYYNQSYGYIHEEYVTDYCASAVPVVTSQEPAPTATQTVTQEIPSGVRVSNYPKAGSYSADGYHMLTNTTVNVRRGASQSYGAKFLLAGDQDVLVINKSGEYFEVYVNGEYGYIHQDYLIDYEASIQKPVQNLVSAAPVAVETGSYRSDGYHMYVAQNANIRKYAQYGATPLYSVTTGTDLLIIDRSGEYLKVYYDGSYGYIHQDYVRDYSSSSPAPKPQSNTGYSASSYGKSTGAVTLSDKISIDDMGSYGDKNIPVSGTVSTNSVSSVSVYLNGYLLSTARLSGNSFSYTIPSNVTLPGNNKVRIIASTNEGTLYQEENFTVNKTPLIVLDTGHGGEDPGALGFLNGSVLYEKDYNFEIMRYLKGYLEGYGFDIVLTRDGDYYVENSTRADTANDNNADLMLSLHHNAGSTVARGGLSIYPSVKYNPSTQASFSESRDLAAKLEDAYLKSGMNYRGAYKDIDISGHTLYIMRNVETRTVLTEMGFISNQQDAEMITDPGFQRLLAKYMAEEIYNYFYGR